MRVFLAAAIVPIAFAAHAQEHKPVMSGDNVQWMQAPAVFPKGAEMAVLHGDPTKSGLFIIRLKMPSGYKIAAHQHPTDEHVTVISGSFHGSMSDKLDQSKGMELNAGGFISLPAKMNHFAWATEPTVVEVAADGPFAMTYVDPKDDPSKQ